MDECVPNHQLLLPENYIVQPVENIPVSMVEYDKMGMTQLIHSGQLTSGTPVIQLADVNSNVKTKELHPLELEIQRDFEIKQQLSKCQTSSVIHSAPQPGQFIKSAKTLEPPDHIFDGVMQFAPVHNGRQNVLNVNPPKPQDSLYHISSLNRQLILEKRQFIIVSDNSMLFNVGSKEKTQTKDIDSGLCKNEMLPKPEIQEMPLLSENYNNRKVEGKEEVADSDSESEEEEDVQPVFDYEPDPDNSTVINIELSEKPNKCYMCFKSFRQKKNMYAHIRKIHSTQPKIEGGILCPLCKMHALRQEHLRNHLETLHEIPIEKEEKLFNTMEDFFSWKEFIERETLSFYVSKSSSKLLANNQQKTYYKCHRSGNYVTLKKENRKKKLKVQGSNKIGATCPAAIEVTENVHGINVIFWKTHVGHDNDLAHLVLSKEDRAKILDYVTAGVSWDTILENIKKEGSEQSSPPSRLTMISKQDLRNIKKIHDLKSSSELFSCRKKVIQGRKPMKERMLRRASQSMVIEKADILLNLLETTDVRPEFRPKICLMIDNLISTVKRRAVKVHKKETLIRKQCESQKWVRQDSHEEREKTKTSDHSHDNEEDAGETNGECPSKRKNFGKQSNGLKSIKKNQVRKRGRPKKNSTDVIETPKT